MRRGLLVLLSGGSLFSACDTRLRDSIVMGTRDFFLGLLDPLTIAEAILQPDEPTAVDP